jgi:hypothetical protein
MKKIVILISFYFLSASLFAQEVSYGLQFSPTVSWLSSSDDFINGNGAKLGLKLGGFAEYFLNDWFGITGGFGFAISQGGNLIYKTGGNLLPNSNLSDSQFNSGEKPLPDDVNITYTLMLLEIPVSAKYLVTTSNDFDFFAEFPVFTLGLLSRSIGAVQGDGVQLTNEKIGPDVNPFNFSWGFGAGIQKINPSGHTLVGGIYFQKGMADLTKDDGTLVKIQSNGTSQKESENSKGNMNGIVFKFAILF